MSQNPDLFPETLLVSREGERIYTTSLKVAEYFGKSHFHVMRTIKKLIAELESHYPKLDGEMGFAERNFALSTYTNARGQSWPMFELSHDGFALLAMGFTGKEALIWKNRFLEAFREMERQLAERKNQIEGAFRRVRPYVLPVLEGTEAGLSRAAIAAPLGKSPASVTYHRSQAKLFGLLH